jgi:UDP-glucose 4-epimerase
MVARPLAPYGASKLAMEGYLSAFAGAYGMNACALRFSNVYGPGSLHKGSVVAHFFKAVLTGSNLTVYGDGSQVRDFLFVGDLVHGIRRAIEGNASGVYQLGSGRPTTINGLISEIGRVTGIEPLQVRYVEARPGEIQTTWCDISKARRELDFDPSTPLGDGLEETWSWFKTHWNEMAARTSGLPVT